MEPLCSAVMPLVCGQGGLPTRNLVVQLTLLQPGGQIMLTTLLLAHPDLKTQRRLGVGHEYFEMSWFESPQNKIACFIISAIFA